MDSNDQSALFLRWHREHQGIILRISRASTWDRTDQEDLIQEISLQIWNSIPNFRGSCKESTWIYRVALNTAISWNRKEKRTREKKAHLVENLPILQEAHEARNERLEWLYEQIRQFDPIDRSLILLHLDGLSYLEISGILGISEKNVGVKLSRLRKKLTQQASQ